MNISSDIYHTSAGRINIATPPPAEQRAAIKTSAKPAFKLPLSPELPVANITAPISMNIPKIRNKTNTFRKDNW